MLILAPPRVSAVHTKLYFTDPCPKYAYTRTSVVRQFFLSIDKSSLRYYNIKLFACNRDPDGI